MSMLPAQISASFLRMKEARMKTILNRKGGKEKKIHARNRNNFYKEKPPYTVLTFYQLCFQVKGRPANTFKI